MAVRKSSRPAQDGTPGFSDAKISKQSKGALLAESALLRGRSRGTGRLLDHTSRLYIFLMSSLPRQMNR